MLPLGYSELICEMLRLTLSDVKLRAKKKGIHFQKRQEALAFIETEWFEALCHAVDLNPVATKSYFIKASQERD